MLPDDLKRIGEDGPDSFQLMPREVAAFLCRIAAVLLGVWAIASILDIVQRAAG